MVLQGIIAAGIVVAVGIAGFVIAVCIGVHATTNYN